LFEHLADENKRAYKLDESANWEDWWNQIPLQMSDLTGPDAPHMFHLCSRCDLGLDDNSGSNTRWHGAPAAHPNDLVLAVKSRMSSLCAHQVALILPAAEVQQLRQTVSKQPVGVFPRRSFSDVLRSKIVRTAESVFHEGSLNNTAFEYLRDWATGTARRKPRPQTYTFLDHRVTHINEGKACQPITPQRQLDSKPRPIIVLHSSDIETAVGPLQSVEQEANQDDEPPLVFHGNSDF
jgi:hypothetical protein